MRIERTLPQNVEAEKAVLGSMMLDPEAVSAIVDLLVAEDFYRDAHRSLYDVMVALYARREVADFITTCDALRERGKPEEVGGTNYILSLINVVPTSANVMYYGRIVSRCNVLRRLIAASAEIAAAAYEAEEDASVVVDRAEQLIFAISQQTNRMGDDASLAELVNIYMEKLDRLSRQRSPLVGVPSGFRDLDRLTGGFRKSDLIVLAARPACGKASCALSIAHQAARRYNRRVGIFSLEMSREQLVERLMAIETGINPARLNSGDIQDEEWDVILEAMEKLSQAPIRVDGTSVLSPMQMRSRARRWVEEGIDLIIIDYLQLMQPGEETARKENRVQVIDEISRNLKLLARELDIPILVLAQLSRAVEQRPSKIPQLSDLRESGGVENNADIVMFIYRDEVYNPVM